MSIVFGVVCKRRVDGGLKLHGNLEGAEFLGAFMTAPIYRLYTIDDIHPSMFEVASGGSPAEAFANTGEMMHIPLGNNPGFALPQIQFSGTPALDRSAPALPVGPYPVARSRRRSSRRRRHESMRRARYGG